MAHLSNVDPWFVWLRASIFCFHRWEGSDLGQCRHQAPYHWLFQSIFFWKFSMSIISFRKKGRLNSFCACIHKFVTEIHRCPLVQFPTLLRQICLNEMIIWLVVSTPLKKNMKVSWDYYSKLNGKVIKFHGSSHHQPD